MSTVTTGLVLQPLGHQAPIRGLVRVVDVYPPLDKVALAELSQKVRRLPQILSLEQLELAITEGKVGVTTCTLPRMMLRDESQIPQRQRDKRDALYDSIKPLVSPENIRRLLYTDARGGLIRAQAREIGVVLPIVYQRLARYFRYGCVPNAFLSANPATRSRLDAKQPGKNARGRKKRRWIDGRWVTHEPKLLEKTDYENFAWARDTYVNKGKSVKHAHGRMTALRYNEGYQDGPDGAEPIIKSLDKVPSIDQFRYWLTHKNDFVELGRKRLGRKAWDKDHRPVLGSSAAEAYGAGHRAQTDTTFFANGSLVSSFDRSVLIGPPIFMVVADVATEFATGLHVTVDNPKYNVARVAIHNCVVDKVAFCARYGVTIKAEDWPADCLHRHYSIDRGELFTENGKAGMVKGLELFLDVHESRMPVLHGLIESRWNIYKGLIYDRVPGLARRAAGGRGAPSPLGGACLTLDEITAIGIRLLIHYNQTHDVSHLLTPAMIAAGVEPTPIGLWRYSLTHDNGKPYRPDPALVEAHLLPRTTATVDRGGIHVEGLRYTSRKALAARWFERGGIRSFNVTAGYDPDDPRTVAIFDPDGDYFDHGTLIDPYKRYALKRLTDILGYMKHEKNVSDALELKRVSSLARADSHIDRLIKHARAATRKATGGRGHKGGKVSGAGREAELVRQKFGGGEGRGGGGSSEALKPAASKPSATQSAYEHSMALIQRGEEEPE